MRRKFSTIAYKKGFGIGFPVRGGSVVAPWWWWKPELELMTSILEDGAEDDSTGKENMAPKDSSSVLVLVQNCSDKTTRGSVKPILDNEPSEEEDDADSVGKDPVNTSSDGTNCDLPNSSTKTTESALRPSKCHSNRNEEVELFESVRERDKLDDLSQLYSIAMTLDGLERLYVKGCDPKEYDKLCRKLLGQYKALQLTLKVDIKKFMKSCGEDCSGGIHRIEQGCTGIHNGGGGCSCCSGGGHDGGGHAGGVQFMITCIDSLKLGIYVLDEVYPLLHDVVHYLGSIGGRMKVEGSVGLRLWLQGLGKRNASYELNGDEGRQLVKDLENTYEELMKAFQSL